MEDTRAKAPVGRGDRAPVAVQPDNLHLEGDFEQRVQEEFQAAERAAVVRHEDNLAMEGRFQVQEPKAWAPGERNAVVSSEPTFPLNFLLDLSFMLMILVNGLKTRNF